MQPTSHYDINADELRAVRARRRQARHRPPSQDAPPQPRRRLKKRATLGWSALGNTLILAGSLVLSLFFLIIGSWRLADYHRYQAQVRDKREQLAAIDKQRDIGRRRLAILNSPTGQEQLLLERGYLPPGDRFLLFPSTPAEERAATIPKNDLSPHPPALENAAAGASAWQRAGRSMGSWWKRFQSDDATARR